MNFNLSDEQKNLVAGVRDFALAEVAPVAARWDEEQHIPRSQIQKLADFGLFGLTFPEAYGGRGLSALEAILVIEEVACHCGISGRLIVDHNFGAVGTILNFGTEEQRTRVLPGVARGETLMAIAMTEPEAGSALTELTTSARREGDAFVLAGTKRWITGGGERELLLVYARFDDIPGPEGIGAILVEMERSGFRTGQRIPSMGVRGVRESYLHFEAIRLPVENLVVAPGAGFKRLMSAYNGQRVAASAVCLGLAQGALDYAVAYANKRRQFDQRITDFQAIQMKIADCTIDLAAARLLVYRAAANAHQTITDRIESSIAKAYAAEMTIRVTNEAIQIMGGDGYSRLHPVERMARDARAFTLAGGSIEMQRLAVAAEVLGKMNDE
ncbi:MAG TPA: acyl-CoA dehydrogenase family protein [Anaerolineae bacterium]|jgi:alkylation response protein AidB-like acyl-CoA dehydrogenase